jgi:hypothetical protein
MVGQDEDELARLLAMLAGGRTGGPAPQDASPTFPELSPGGPQSAAGQEMNAALMQPPTKSSMMDNLMGAVQGFMQTSGAGGGAMSSLGGGAAGEVGGNAATTTTSGMASTLMDMGPSTPPPSLGMTEPGAGAAGTFTPPTDWGMTDPGAGAAGLSTGVDSRMAVPGGRVPEPGFPDFPTTPSGGITSEESLKLLKEFYRDKRKPGQAGRNMGRLAGIAFRLYGGGA